LGRTIITRINFFSYIITEMYPKGINHGGLGMKNAGGKLMGAAKGSNGVSDNAMMAAMAMVAPESAKKPYGKIEKK